MQDPVLEVAIVALLIVLNGVFAASELAVVSSRPVRLRNMIEMGRPGARAALALAADPGRFLSAVQIGITLVGIINGAYSGTSFGAILDEHFERWGMPSRFAEPLGFGLVVLVVTYLSLIVGELVPKQIALRNAENIACAVAPMMTVVSRVASPAVTLLDASSKLVFRLLGIRPDLESKVTEEEIRTLIAEAETAGVLEGEERRMIAGVMRLGDRAVRGIMTPRTDVDWIDATSSEDDIRARLISTPHSRLPVGDGSADTMIGVVQTRELLASILSGRGCDVRGLVRKAPIVPETLDALDALSVLRDAEVPMALIHDEYGNFKGVVTPADVLEAIAGVFRSDIEDSEPYAVERDDGSWLLSGAMPVDEMSERLGIVLPVDRSYQTVAGYVLAQLQHLPKVGEHVTVGTWRFEVVDLDGRRIDKVLVARASTIRHRA